MQNHFKRAVEALGCTLFCYSMRLDNILLTHREHSHFKDVPFTLKSIIIIRSLFAVAQTLTAGSIKQIHEYKALILHQSKLTDPL